MFWSNSLLLISLSFLLPLAAEANDLASALAVGCPTAADFCSRYLEPTHVHVKATQKIFYSSTTIYTLRRTLTAFGTTTLSTKIRSHTLTSTVGLHTTTVEKCNPVATCGAVTIAHQASLRAACTRLEKDLKTPATRTSTYALLETYVYDGSTTIDRQTTIGTPTFTVLTTTVPTQTVYDCVTAPPPERTCHNSGFEYAHFDLTAKDKQNPPSKWDLASYKTRQPYKNGTTSNLGGYYTSESSKLKKREVDGCYDEYSNVRGYIYAPQTGTYKISVPAYDQAAYIWIGKHAYSGYTRANALIKAFAPGHKNDGGPSATYHLKRGTYTPFRSAFRCISSTEYTFYFNIHRPDGLVMIGEYSPDGEYPDTIGSSSFSIYNPGFKFVTSDYFVHFGCGADADLAPPFPAWGHET